MPVNICWRLAIAAVLLPAGARLSAEDPPAVRFRDDFAADSRKDYKVEGEVSWRKGALTLGKGATLSRPLELGFRAEVRVVLRWAEGGADGELFLGLTDPRAGAGVALRRQSGRMVLTLLGLPSQAVKLGEDKPKARDAWVVRLRVDYGEVRVRAWRRGDAEPADWQALGYMGAAGWVPHSLDFQGGSGAVGLEECEVQGEGRLRVSAERAREAARAAKLTEECVRLHREGKLAEALGPARQAVALFRMALPPLHPHLFSSLDNLGQLLWGLGQREEAHRHLGEALALRRKALPPTHPAIASSLSSLGWLLQDLGRCDEARGHYQETLAIYRKILPPNHPDLATSLNNLGTLLNDLGKRDEARQHFEEALAIYRKAPPPLHPDVALCLNNLGVLLQDLGRHREAREHLSEALALRRKALPPTHPLLALSLNNQGALLAAIGKREEARKHYEEALAIYRKALPPTHPDLAKSLNNLGTLLQDLGQRDGARRHYEEALAINRKVLPPLHPDLATSLHNLGALLYEGGDPAAGWEHLRDAVGTRAAYLARTAAGSAQRDHADLLRKHRASLEMLLSAAVQTPPPAAFGAQELLAAVLDAKAASGTALGLRREALLLATDPEAARLAGRLEPLRRRLADLLLQGPGRLTPERYREACAESKQEHDTLERDLAQRVRPYADLRRAERAGPTALAERLSAGAVLVELVKHNRWDFGRQRWGEAHYLAVLLWAKGGGKFAPEIRLVDLGQAAPIDHAVHAWRAAARKGEIDDKSDREVRERVWGPLAKELPEKTSRLFVAPDGELSLLPFEAIRLEDGKYLVEKLAVSYLTTGRDLMPRPLPKERSDAALVVADPDYDADAATADKAVAAVLPGEDLTRSFKKLKRLPGFAREADAVEGLLRGKGDWKIETRRGPEASEEALRSVARPRLLHCVTHGFFLEDAPRLAPEKRTRELELADAGPKRWRMPDPGPDPRLRSGLALAGANKWQERSKKGLSDGLLTALEVEGLDLWGTELVVLSACDTGRGEVQVGEGVLGLRRAFQLAGAQCVLASLWPVPDAETEQLMSDCLQRWSDGAPPAEALRRAQLEMIRKLRAGKDEVRKQAPPLLWAGFICHGRTP